MSQKPLFSKTLFYLLLFILPINLGSHYVVKSAYVNGLLVDYLIPTVYIQDIVAFLLLVCWFREDRKKLAVQFSGFYPQLILVFLFAAFLSVLLAPRTIPSLSAFIRLALYCLVSIYTKSYYSTYTDKKFLVRAFTFWLIFLGMLGSMQYAKQASVFNNYLFLGEQPYSSATPGVLKENVFNIRKIPAYGIFRHPNIFGGFMVVGLVWVLHELKRNRKRSVVKRVSEYAAFFFGVCGLVVTFSYIAWVAGIVGMFLLLLEGRGRRFAYWAGSGLAVLVFLAALNLNYWKLGEYLTVLPSVSKRVELLKAGKGIVLSENPFFGVGINNQTVVIEKFLVLTNYLRFVQPTHNVYVLLAGEIGILGVALYCVLLAYSVYRAVKLDRFIVFVSLVLIVLLSSFDHYFFTIHQTLLLFWVTLGIANSLGRGLD